MVVGTVINDEQKEVILKQQKQSSRQPVDGSYDWTWTLSMLSD